MKLNDSVFYSAPTASKSFQGIGHRVDSIVQLAVDQHISHPGIHISLSYLDIQLLIYFLLLLQLN